MKANLLLKNIPVKRINVTFLVKAEHIETAIIALWVNGLGATKGKIEEEIKNMFYSGGLDGWANWVDEENHKEYIDKAKELAQKLFPTFYKNN